MDKLKQLLEGLSGKFSQVKFFNKKKEDTISNENGSFLSSLGSKEKIAVIVSVVSFLFILVGFFNSSNPKTTSIKAKNNVLPAADNSKENKSISTDKTNTPNEISNSVSVKNNEKNVTGNNITNPFIDASALHNTASSLSDGMSIPAIPNHSVPVPNVGTVPIPNIPSAKSQTPIVKEPAKVKGIASSSNGKTIAIMSDGTVLTEGECFADDRVAYIGGDGVTLDSGKQFDYNIEEKSPNFANDRKTKKKGSKDE